jgi:transcriptional regulator with XRE-family HTH domain
MTQATVINLDGNGSTFQSPPTARLSRSTVRQARLLLGLSQDEIGRLVGLTSTSINNFENGRTLNLRPRHEAKVRDVFKRRGIDLGEGGAIRLRRPPRAAAAE